MADLIFERDREAAAAVGPMHIFDHDAAARAVDEFDLVAQLDLDAAKIEMPPPALASTVRRAALPETTTASRGAVRGRNVDHDPVVFGIEAENVNLLEREKNTAYTVGAHRGPGRL